MREIAALRPGTPSPGAARQLFQTAAPLAPRPSELLTFVSFLQRMTFLF